MDQRKTLPEDNPEGRAGSLSDRSQVPNEIANLRYANYWLTRSDIPPGTEGPPLESVDVAVIGAGFAGLAAALELAKFGVRTMVLESETVGWGASCRNGGMVLTGLKLSAETLVRRYGIEVAQRMYSASLAAIDCVEEIVRAEAIECDFRRCGHVEVASKKSHFTSYARSAEFIARHFHHTVHIVSPRELAQEVGSEIYHGGLVDEASAGLQPARYVAGLGRAALRAGAAIYEKCAVERLEPGSQRGEAGFSLSTSRGKVFAREVFISAGAYGYSLLPAMRKKVIPIGSFIIATEPLSDSLSKQLSPRNRMIYDSRHYLHYFRLTPDNRMLFGGRAAFLPETPSRVGHSAMILQRDMVRVFPQLRDAMVEYIWGGTLDFCFDTMPHAGSVAGVHYVIGFAGHGVAMATYLGTQIARKIAATNGQQPFDKIPFPNAPVGLYGERPWLLPLAGAFYKVLDWIS
jgi:glycine/D-amino acid oxidase-like deaminating enzyme